MSKSKRRNNFPSDRVTIMIRKDIDVKLKLDLAKEIANSVKHTSDYPGTSYSRIINAKIELAFEKELDKKIITDIIKKND